MFATLGAWRRNCKCKIDTFSARQCVDTALMDYEVAFLLMHFSLRCKEFSICDSVTVIHDDRKAKYQRQETLLLSFTLFQEENMTSPFLGVTLPDSALTLPYFFAVRGMVR